MHGEIAIKNEDFTITAEMMIRKPAAEVFGAFIDPAITVNFWFSASSGKLKPGETVTWRWDMYNVSAAVTVEKIIENTLIQIDWGDPMPKVQFAFTALDETSTYVTIKNYGCKATGREFIDTLLGQLGGFTTVLDGLKAYLEHGINLNLIGDKFPRGIT